MPQKHLRARKADRLNSVGHQRGRLVTQRSGFESRRMLGLKTRRNLLNKKNYEVDNRYKHFSLKVPNIEFDVSVPADWLSTLMQS